MKILASDSRLMRSKRAATSRPRPTLPAVATTSQMHVVAKDLEERRPCARLAQLSSVKRAVVVLEAADHGDDGGIDEVDRRAAASAGRDEDPRAGCDRGVFGRRRSTSVLSAGEQQPDPADADEQRDRGEQELGDELVALAVAQQRRRRRSCRAGRRSQARMFWPPCGSIRTVTPRPARTSPIRLATSTIATCRTCRTAACARPPPRPPHVRNSSGAPTVR